MTTKQSIISLSEHHLLDVQLIKGEVVRLIKLTPGSGTQPLLLELSIHELAHSPPFDAISYVWGDETKREDIECNRRPLSVTKSLASALKRVRLPDKPRMVWADAICINQRDDLEKAHHVAFMRKVYEFANLVLICMGSDPDGAGLHVISLLESHSKRMGYPRVKDMAVLHCSDATFLDSRWKSLAILMGNVWWTRAWTLQESGVAKAPWVMWGDVEISYRALMRLNRWIVACADELQPKYGISLLTIHSDWEQWAEGWEKVQDYPYTVVDFLSHAKGLGCKEPRDHVFAFIGHPLLQKENESGPLITVSYKVPVIEVFKELTKLILAQVGLSILAAVEHDKPTIEDMSTPSWVVSWDKDIIQNSFGYFQGFYYDAARSAPPVFTIQFPADSDSWAVQGAIPALSGNPALRSILEGIRRIAIEGARDKPCKYTPSERKDALSLTLTAGLRDYLSAEDRMHLHRADREAFWQVFDTILVDKRNRTDAAEIAGDESISRITKSLDSGSADRYFYDLSLACKGRCFVMTESGHWGVGPWVTRVNDDLVVVRGAKVPFVLRRLTVEHDSAVHPRGVADELEECESREEYRLVGEAYLHGVMRGEAVENAATWTEIIVS
jgi:hypothetical protein